MNELMNPEEIEHFKEAMKVFCFHKEPVVLVLQIVDLDEAIRAHYRHLGKEIEVKVREKAMAAGWLKTIGKRLIITTSLDLAGAYVKDPWDLLIYGSAIDIYCKITDCWTDAIVENGPGQDRIVYGCDAEDVEKLRHEVTMALHSFKLRVNPNLEWIQY